ncbi:hypothetical protein BH11VER1_BH11VER1_41880 [soil metagenome]
MDTTQIFLALLIGAIGGVVAALCGVGGGVIMVPAFVLLMALPQKQAVATSLMVIIPTALVASLKNHQNGFGDWKIALVTAVAASATAWFAADWLKTLQTETLTRIFGVIMLIMGVRMLFFGKG